MWTQRAGVAVLLVLALAVGAARADDARSAQDPDPSLLEFLGGVDGLADANPDYLAQMSNAQPVPAQPRDPAKPVVPPPKPGAPGEQNSE